MINLEFYWKTKPQAGVIPGLQRWILTQGAPGAGRAASTEHSAQRAAFAELKYLIPPFFAPEEVLPKSTTFLPLQRSSGEVCHTYQVKSEHLAIAEESRRKVQAESFSSMD